MGDLPGVVGCVGIGVDVAAALIAERAEFVEVGHGVYLRQLPLRRAVGRRCYEVAAEMKVFDRCPRRLGASGALGVSRIFVSGVVIGTVNDQHGGSVSFCHHPQFVSLESEFVGYSSHLQSLLRSEARACPAYA